MAIGDPWPRLERAIDASSHERFVEAVGRRAALLGDERGNFECWLWPLKIAHAVHARIRFDDGAAIEAPSIARRVEIDPFRLRIDHRDPRASLSLRAFAPLDLAALVLLFDVDAREPVTLELSWTPDFRPMWPAGLGGQIALRDPESGAFALTEELGRFAALIGGPEVEPFELDADHGLPREPVVLALRVTPARAALGPMPVFVVGAQTAPRPLSRAARLGDDDAARGRARSHEVLGRARELYRRAALEWPDWEEEHERRASGSLARGARFESSEPAHDQALLWARIAIERAWVEVDGLGRGLVAGLAPSRSGERPGFGWFFDGDALAASRAQTLEGDFDGARAVLEFAASHQRDDGKLMHELVLSAALCDWTEDYPYAYYKGVNTLDFLAALRFHVDASDDRALLERLWPTALRAFRHALACVGDDGLYSVRKAGMAAVEAGPLAGKLESEVFAHGLWIDALIALERLCELRGERELVAQLALELRRARGALELLWDRSSGAFAFGRLRDGSLWPDVTAYHGALLQTDLGEHEPRAAASVQRLNAPELASDWGLRMFPTDSAVYDADHYNCGSVFPYLGDFAIRALYRHGACDAAWQVLASQARLAGFQGLGLMPEHLVGDRASAPERGVPHQIFSSSAIVQSTLRGMLGLELDAPERRLTLRPALPPTWSFAALERLRVGASELDLRVERDRDAGELRVRARLCAGPPIELLCEPIAPALSRFAAVTVDGAERAAAPEPLGPSVIVRGARATIEREALLRFALREGPSLALELPLARDQRSSHLRLVRAEVDGDAVRWTLCAPDRADRGARGRRVRCLRGVPVRLEGARAIDGDWIEIESAPRAGERGSCVVARVERP